MLRSRFIGVGAALPSTVVGNAEIEARLGVEPGWIEGRTGVRERRVVREDETLVERTYYALITTDQKFLEQTPEDLVRIPASFLKKREIPIWTDRYHNLFQVLR